MIWALMDDRRVLSMAVLFTAITIPACMSSPEPFHEGPDLIPVKRTTLAGPEGFCDLIPGASISRLRVSVRNGGQSGAPASITTIEFMPGGSLEIPTPPIAADAVIELPPVTIPAACFDPDCDFRILVDSRSDVNEASGEADNAVDGRCLRQ
jgi:hypothetical protein